MNGLVMLLPHGYDGAGPEHSSSRVERYLQLCNQDDTWPIPGGDKARGSADHCREVNMRVVNCSTAANYFHMLRGHMRMPFRKPVIVVAPKKLLRLRSACSTSQDFSEEKQFQDLIPDTNANAIQKDRVKKVLLCTGQVYYDLEAKRAADRRNDVAILRVESLCPFPFKEIAQELKSYGNASVTWAQEEPKNAGVWLYAEPRLRNIATSLGRDPDGVAYAGRPIMSATAVGFAATHTAQLQDLLDRAFK